MNKRMWLTVDIWTQTEHAELYRLSYLPKILYKDRECIENTHFSETEKGEYEALLENLASAIARPVWCLGLKLGYVMKLVHSYSDHKCRPHKWSKIIVGQARGAFSYSWKCLDSRLFPWSVGWHLWCHDRVINLVSANEQVKTLLQEALDQYEDLCGLKYVHIHEKNLIVI